MTAGMISSCSRPIRATPTCRAGSWPEAATGPCSSGWDVDRESESAGVSVAGTVSAVAVQHGPASVSDDEEKVSADDALRENGCVGAKASGPDEVEMPSEVDLAPTTSLGDAVGKAAGDFYRTAQERWWREQARSVGPADAEEGRGRSDLAEQRRRGPLAKRRKKIQHCAQHPARPDAPARVVLIARPVGSSPARCVAPWVLDRLPHVAQTVAR